jgi:hypothetical protein
MKEAANCGLSASHRLCGADSFLREVLQGKPTQLSFDYAKEEEDDSGKGL